MLHYWNNIHCRTIRLWSFLSFSNNTNLHIRCLFLLFTFSCHSSLCTCPSYPQLYTHFKLHNPSSSSTNITQPPIPIQHSLSLSLPHPLSLPPSLFLPFIYPPATRNTSFSLCSPSALIHFLYLLSVLYLVFFSPLSVSLSVLHHSPAARSLQAHHPTEDSELVGTKTDCHWRWVCARIILYFNIEMGHLGWKKNVRKDKEIQNWNLAVW